MKRFRMIARLFMLSIVLVCVSYPVMSADAKKVIIQNITLNVTVIIPITVVAQNAQICISLASSGDQTCQLIILDPTQTTFTPVDVDLTEEQPLITSGSTNQTSTTATNQTGTTTPTSSNETSSFAGNSNKTFEPGKSNITNPTNDPGQNKSANPTASDNQNAKEDKDTNQEEQKEPTQDGDTEDGNSEEP
ncbi:MAG TPA: hypothetical protein VE548_05275 [Nitrososphaeraceae archaeon]|nr:hypothetical protein [Nitrososphaeraceae archaeon]